MSALLEKTCTRCKVSQPLASFSPCKRSSSGRQPSCKACAAARRARWRLENPEKSRNEWRAVPKEKRAEQFRRWYDSNIEKCKVDRKADYEKNRDVELAKARDYKIANRARLAAQNKIWLAAHPESTRIGRAMRRGRERRAVPSWVDAKKIAAVFAAAARLTAATGIPHEVDHIVPLHGHGVCGLHWHGNLQVLPRSENRAKSNKRWPNTLAFEEAA